MRPDWITVVPSVQTATMPSPRAWLQTTDYRLARSIRELEDYVYPYLNGHIVPAVDWETSGLNVWRDQVVGLSVSCQTGTGVYVPLAHYTGAEFNLPKAGVLEVLHAIDAAGPSLWYNYRFDSGFMVRDGWEPVKWRDVMIAVYLADPNVKQYGLKYTAARLLGVEMLEYTDLLPDGGGFHLVHPLEAPPYAVADADLTRRIFYLPEVQKALAEQPFIWEVETKCVLPLRDTVDHGCWIDATRLGQQAAALGAILREKKGGKSVVVGEVPGLIPEARRAVFAACGGAFDLDSPQQLGQQLVKLGVPITEKTEKTQQVATGQEVLAKYADQYPVVWAILKYRKLDKQRRDYIDKLTAWVEAQGPHARFAFNQIGAPTGRMSAGGEGSKGEAEQKGYVDLNVQSIPDHEKEPYLPNIRAAFVANDPRADSDEWVIVAIDYSQIELRVAANLFREPLWIEAFLRGEDIHTTNARLAYRDPTITKADPRRKMGKTMNFATLYGAQPDTVAEHGKIPVALAKQMLDNFFGQARQLSEGIGRLKAAGKAHQKVSTYFGRIRPLTEYFHPEAPRWLQLKGEREAVNSPIQGGAADIFKVACHKVRATLFKHGWQEDWQPILYVHDELVSRVKRVSLDTMVPVIQQAMEFPVRSWPVPIKADVEVGWNWGELVPYADWLRRFPAGSAGERVVQWLP